MAAKEEETMDSRIPFDEDGDNGLVFNGKYLPEELISEILFNLDCDTLLNCHLVCARWKTLMETYVWRKKAENIFHHSLNSLDGVDWSIYYAICKKRPFERNLLKNSCAQNGVKKHWKILENGGHKWKAESPPVGIPPLPPGVWPYKGIESCFVTSFQEAFKQQTINLSSEGLSPHILDTFQPPIMISEWYGCRFDCGGIYECCVKLLDDDDKVIDNFRIRSFVHEEAVNKWHYMSHVFENYGTGVRKIVFYHGGIDLKTWAGHYGPKMTCASVRVKILKEPESTLDTSCLPIEQPEKLPVDPNEPLSACRFRLRRNNVIFHNWD